MACAGSPRNAAAAALLMVVCSSFLMSTGFVEAFNSILLQQYYLGANQFLGESPWTLKMQTDCNLVLYRDNRAVWSTNTNGRGTNCYFLLQNDGNGVLWSGDGRYLWQTNTANMNNGPHFLKLQYDGNIVMYNVFGFPLWASNTAVPIGGNMVNSTRVPSPTRIVSSVMSPARYPMYLWRKLRSYLTRERKTSYYQQ